MIGAGFIGEVHARALRRAGARLVGVAASSPDTTDDAVTRLGAERGFAAVDLATSPEVDVIHICTPNHLHAPLARAALEAGKHVVCEKPLTTDPTVAAELLALVDRAGVVATVPFVYRFYPMVREARARVAHGPLAVRLVHGSYLQDWLSTEQDDNWRVDAELSGASRAFADIGSHWCDLVEFVTGDRLASVCAELVTAVPERSHAAAHLPAFGTTSDDETSGPRRAVSTEDVALVLFRTVAGASGSVVVSQISAGRKNQLRLEVVTDGATLAFDQEHPDTLWLGRRSSSEIVERDPNHLDPTAAPYAIVPAGHPQGYQDCFDAFVADTLRAVDVGTSTAVDGLPTFADGARAVEITDAVLRSSRDGGWVDVAAVSPAEREEVSP
ncbi:MAG TPA: Gfo/Idh/MocA family oxidoreductase [Microthrixaceae bacterium]|nr:Gfo/Idh/MocA family oxidoreductase [Microthrixaceae bacterium]